MRLIIWILKALVFFTLFAFALNNQHPASVHWFFGLQWQAPMGFVVLAAFAAGCALGVAAMVPGRWRTRQVKREAGAGPSEAGKPAAASTGAAPSDEPAAHPPRDGL
ncbi:MAG: lipopolysaccharide assembly LapA domain-containing protein [Rubrivivax sp.]